MPDCDRLSPCPPLVPTIQPNRERKREKERKKKCLQGDKKQLDKPWKPKRIERGKLGGKVNLPPVSKTLYFSVLRHNKIFYKSHY